MNKIISPKRDVVMVVGGTGSLGKSVVKELQQQGISMRILGRSWESFTKAEYDENIGDLVVCSDVTNPSMFQDDWFTDVKLVVCIARPRWSKPGDRVAFEALLVNLSDAICRNKVPRFLLLGLPYVDKYQLGMTPNMNAFKQSEMYAIKRFSISNISKLTITRITEISEIGHLLEIAKKSGVWMCMRKFEPRLQPISSQDFALAVARFAENNENFGHSEELLVGGPQVITWRKLGRAISAAIGKRLLFLELPLWFFKILLPILRIGGKLWPVLEGIENVLKLVAIPMTSNSTSDAHKSIGNTHIDNYLREHAKPGRATDVQKRISGSRKKATNSDAMKVLEVPMQ